MLEVQGEKLDVEANVASLKSDLEKSVKRKEVTEAIATRLKGDLAQSEVTVSLQSDEIAKLKSEMKRLNASHRELLRDLQREQHKHENAENLIEKLRQEHNSREEKVADLQKEIDALELEVSNKQCEVHSLKLDQANILKERGEFRRKAVFFEKRKFDLEKVVDLLKEEIGSMRKDILNFEHAHNESTNKIRDISRKRDSMSEENLDLKESIEKLHAEEKLLKENILTLKNELKTSKTVVTDLKDTIEEKDSEINSLTCEIKDLKKEMDKLNTEVKNMQVQVKVFEGVADSLKQELEESIKKYTVIEEDRRFYQKSCLDGKRELVMKTDQLTTLKKHAEQLQVVIKGFHDEGQKYAIENKITTGKLRSAEEALKRVEDHVTSMKTQLRQADDDKQKLLRKMAEHDNSGHVVETRLKGVCLERDVLVNKLRDRDAQLASNKDRMKLLEKHMANLEGSLATRVEDVKLLKLHLGELSRSHALMTEQVRNMQAIRQELCTVQTALQDQKLKCKGLEEELQRPTNFHRWRVLEGTDPDRTQLLNKNQALQKQLTKKATQLDAKEVALKKKEELEQDLRMIIQRRGDEKVEEQLWDCRRELKARTQRVKCLSAENNMYESVVAKYKAQTLSLKEELRKYKMAEFHEKAKRRKIQVAASE